MPTAAPPTGLQAQTMLVVLGARVRAQRKALGVSATTAAEAAAVSRVTLHRIERGEPSVAMGSYANVIAALGLSLDLLGPQTRAPKKTRELHSLPKRIPLAQYPELKRVAWQLSRAISITPKEALAFYERNWRHVDRHMGEEERALVRLLIEKLGSRRLLV